MRDSVIKFGFDMTTTDVQDFRQQFFKAVSAELTEVFQKSLIDIKNDLGKFIRERIEDTPEYQSITTGQLHGELGLVNPKASMDAVIAQVIDSMQLQIDNVGFSSSYSMRGGISLNLIPSNYADLLGLPAAKYTSNQYEIPWLEWLLIKGNNLLVLNYRVITNLNVVSKRYSRTGKGLMIKSKTRNWRVPPQYQGTPDDNFLLRAFISDEVEWKMLLLFRYAILKNLENV